MNKYLVRDNEVLLIEDTVLDKLYQYCQIDSKPENGGILLGKVKNDFTEIIITDISLPCKKDIKKRFSFVRDKNNTQNIVNNYWRESSGLINYLGEWHTHPEIIPTPSSVDRKLIKDGLKYNIQEYDFLILIIVGMYKDLYVGYQKKHDKEIRTLKLLKRL